MKKTLDGFVILAKGFGKTEQEQAEEKVIMGSVYPTKEIAEKERQKLTKYYDPKDYRVVSATLTYWP
ncbi:MAG: hypothetical protein KGI03_00775 [Patescibacteria group bacterium]|nr:hypothetical protein [Patescibacteria group bacterium]